jgi:membrane protease YdiL (CAAX protease family)
VPVVGALFAIGHLGNPDVQLAWLGIAYFFCVGAFITLVTLRDNRLELGIGIHAANNLFVQLVISFPASSLPAEGIWTSTISNPVYVLASFLVAAGAFYWLILRRRPARLLSLSEGPEKGRNSPRRRRP